MAAVVVDAVARRVALSESDLLEIGRRLRVSGFEQTNQHQTSTKRMKLFDEM